MYIYCEGTLTNNGTISMTARGAKAVGQNVYLFKNLEGNFEYIPAVGGVGGASVRGGSITQPVAGRSGAAGTRSFNSWWRIRSWQICRCFWKRRKWDFVFRWNWWWWMPTEALVQRVRTLVQLEVQGTMVEVGAGNPGGTGYGARGANGTGGLLIILSNNILGNGTVNSSGSLGAVGDWDPRGKFRRRICKFIY